VYSEYCKLLFPTDGQFKLGVILLDKYTKLKNEASQILGSDNKSCLKQFLCEEFFNYLTPYQLLFIQCVLGSQSATGHAMWYINDNTSTLFNTPADQNYKFITKTKQYEEQRTAHCDESLKPYYISISINALFNHINPSLNMTLTQYYDAINILDMPGSLSEQVNKYLRILTPEQSNIVYL
jgi:hypothetical protein